MACPARMLFGLLLIAGTISLQIGCATSSRLPRPNFASLIHQSAKIPADSTKQEIVDYVNQHTSPIHAWRSTSARLTISGVPVPMKAMLAVEESNHFRLMVSNGLTGHNEVDLGSNPDQVWFWARQMEPKAVITCKHQEIEALQAQLPFPFQPEWMMQVLCVQDVDAETVELVRDPSDPYLVKLIGHHTSPSGQTVRKITTINLKQGVITEHQLYDSQHCLLATAKLSDYRSFPNTSAKLPHDIQLHWAQQDMKMHVTLNGVEVNPPQLPTSIWHVPQMAEYPVHEIHRDQLIQQVAGGQGHPAQNKPKAITQYELDQPSGAWLQEQKFVDGDRSPATSGQIKRTINENGYLSTHAMPVSNSAGMAAVQATPWVPEMSQPEKQSANLQPAAEAGPWPEWAQTQPVSTPATSESVSKKSRNNLLMDGVPASEFEPPVKRSVAN